jgi:hypothetical protein
MQTVNTIPLNSKITVYGNDGVLDKYGKPSSYTKTEINSAVFDVLEGSRENYMQEIKYSTVIYVKDVVLKTNLIYVGITTETETVNTREIRKISTMKDVFQRTEGYKIWL